MATQRGAEQQWSYDSSGRAALMHPRHKAAGSKGHQEQLTSPAATLLPAPSAVPAQRPAAVAGRRGPASSLNGARRRMILTATCASAFDSIIRRRVGLLYQKNYLECLLFPFIYMQPKLSQRRPSHPGSQCCESRPDRRQPSSRVKVVLEPGHLCEEDFLTGRLRGQKQGAVAVDVSTATQLRSAGGTAVFHVCRTHFTQYWTVLRPPSCPTHTSGDTKDPGPQGPRSHDVSTLDKLVSFKSKALSISSRRDGINQLRTNVFISFLTSTPTGSLKRF